MFLRNSITNTNLLTGLTHSYTFEGNSNNYNGTTNGTDTDITYNNGKIGQCAAFNGSSSFVSFSTKPINENADYSISFWCKWTALNNALVFNQNFNGTVCIGVGLITGSGTITFRTIVNGSANVDADSGITPVLGQWYHIVITFTYNVTATLRLQKIYVDGVLKATASPVGGSTQGASNIFYLGRSTAFFSGLLDELSIWNRVLSDSEAKSLYNGGNGLTNPFSYYRILKNTDNSTILSGLTAYWKMENNSTDSMNRYHGIDTSVIYSTGKVNLGAGFNGTSSKIQVADGINSPFRQTTAITYSLWVSLPSGGNTRIGTASSGGQGSGGIFIDTVSCNFAWTPTNPNSDRTWSTTFSLSANTWYHLAFTMNFSGASIGNWYLNGSAMTTTLSSSVTTATPNTSYNSNNGDCIGARFLNSFFYGNASIDEVGIWNRVLSANEINLLYNNNIGYSISMPKVFSAYDWDADALAYFAQLTPSPSVRYQKAINELVKELKAHGNWTKLDRLWIHATEAQQHAKVSLVNPASPQLTEFNSPTWTANRGYSGNGSTMYINTNFKPASSGVTYTMNAASLGIYTRVDGISSSSYPIGVNGAGANDRALIGFLPNIDYRLNSINSTSISNTGTSGFYTAVRTSSTSKSIYRNGSLINTTVDTATNLPSLDIFLLAFNAAGVATLPTTNQLSLSLIGGAVNPITLSNAVQNFANKIGFQV